MVVVCGFRGHFEFVIHLIEKFLGLGRVAVHVPLVGLLRGGNFFPGLARKVLRRGKVRMFVGRLRCLWASGRRLDRRRRVPEKVRRPGPALF